ncbi:MAG: MATE family efflux transporter [Phycisphaerales bacterium]|nr:MATE family efflux transporter [Phycisphaerae bacterium]NNF43573.1 MATE family efflux transporter [Phycisphaerales bacterium]NNM24627.1 MATE family efflux transporter [Phycisphaerales bacterium]
MTAPPTQLDDATPLRPLAEVWSIAWPTVLTMTSYPIMQFVDKLMVGQVGPLEVAAQGNGGIWSFTPIAFAFGVLTVVNTFVSQNLGAGRAKEGPKYAWAAIWLSVLAWLFVLLPWAAMLEHVFTFIHRPQVDRLLASLSTLPADAAATVRAELDDLDRLVTLETEYGRILLVGALVLMMGKGIHHYFFGLHRPKVVTLSALCGNLTNVLLNYTLIFGADGLVIPTASGGLTLPGVPGVPALGLRGAAIGTVIGTLVEVAIPLAIFLGPRMNASLASRSVWKPRLGPMRDLIRIGWPAAVQFGNEIVCWSIFMSVLVGLFGTNHQTAGWIVLSYMHLSFMPAVGFSVAVTSLVGKYIGAGEPDTAVNRARLGLAISVVYMTICGAALYFFREPMVRWFIGGGEVTAAETEAIVVIGAKLMICAAIFQTVDAFGIVYTGALRGAGDTVWPGVVTIIYSWSLIVGGGWAMTVLWPQLESVGPWIGASVYIVLFGVTMAWRFESGRWRSIRLLGDIEADAARRMPPAPALPASEADAVARDIAPELGEAAVEREDDPAAR